MLAGFKPKWQWSLKYPEFDSQVRYCFETLDDRKYLVIAGNHEASVKNHVGITAGARVQDYFHARSRTGFRYLGANKAIIEYEVPGADRAIRIEVKHPRNGMGVSKSMPLQNIVRGYSRYNEPDILLAGHWHGYCHVEERAIQAVACPTFEWGGSDYSKSLSGGPALGRIMLRFTVSADGRIRKFAAERNIYYPDEALDNGRS